MYIDIVKKRLLRIEKLAKEMGIEIIPLKAEEWPKQDQIDNDPDFYIMPFNETLAIDWSKKQILYIQSEEQPFPHWIDLIHEMGHLIATVSKPPACDEASFFAWEYLIAKKIKAGTDWLLCYSKGYTIYETAAGQFSDLSRKMQNSFMEDSIKVGNLKGNIKEGQPVCLR